MDLDSLRKIKKEMDELRKRMNSTKDIREREKIVSKTLELSLEYNKKTMVSLLYTTIPAILIFGVIINHYTYEPLRVGVPFNISIYTRLASDIKVHQMITEYVDMINVYNYPGESKITYELRPKKQGLFNFEFTIGNKTYSKDFLVTDLYKVTSQKKEINDGTVNRIEIEYKPLVIFPYKIFGFQPGRLFFYILFSVILNILFRRLFDLP